MDFPKKKRTSKNVGFFKRKNLKPSLLYTSAKYFDQFPKKPLEHFISKQKEKKSIKQRMKIKREKKNAIRKRMNLRNANIFLSESTGETES